MEEAITANHETISSIAIAEQKETVRKTNEPTVQPTKKFSPEKTIFSTQNLIILGTVLFVVAGGLIYGTYAYLTSSKTPSTPTETVHVLVSYSSKGTIILDPSNTLESFKTGLANQIKKNSNVGSITNITVLVGTTTVSIQNIFTLLNPSAPSILARSFTSEYSLGTYATGKTNEPFLVLSVNSFGHVYTGMLTWEKTMVDDLKNIFPNIRTANIDPTTPWSDYSFDNRDTRIIRDNTGSIVALYGFLDKQTLVIAPSEATFKAVFRGYTNAKLVK
jgi:hypothetical protein